MCGRYDIFTNAETLARRFHATWEEAGRYQPHYNAAPSQLLPLIRNDARDVITLGQWGFLPSWARGKPIKPMINARAETVAAKPMFRGAYTSHRCLVLAEGFYEWKQTDAGKIPYRITRTDGQPFAFAGLFSQYDVGGEEPRTTFTILTTAPNALMADIHHRMPVILLPNHEEAWLCAPRPALLIPYPSDAMRAYPVSRKVNNPHYDAPDVIDAVTSC
jgi:putative SOS response-associated peptidase YedK